MQPIRRFVFSACVLVAMAASVALAQPRRSPTVDDMLDLVTVSSPQISPDGSRVLFTRSDLKVWKDNKRVSSVWIANTDGSGARPFLGSDKDRSPLWSPDGRWVAFLSTRDASKDDGQDEAGAQIWLIPTAGGEAAKLSDHKSGISRFRWSDDSTRIFFTADEPKSDEEKAAEKAGDDAILVDEGPNGQTRDRYGELWVIAVDTRQARRIVGGGLFVGDFAPAPDGARVAMIYRRENTRNGANRAEIAVVDVATGEMKDLTKNQAPESSVEWTPDASAVSFMAPSDTSWELSEGRLWVMPAGGGPARAVSSQFAGRMGDYYWTTDGIGVVFGGTKNGRGGVYHLDVASGHVRTIATGDWVAGLDSVTRDLTRGACVLSTPTAPGDVHVVDLGSGATARITNLNPQVADWQLAQVRAMTWKSRDGLQVEGLLWLPADYKEGTALPLLLSIHGGPAGVFSMSFRNNAHVYAGLGWAVLEPNVRGSSSYGDGFLRGNMHDIGGGDYQDLMTGVDALVAQAVVDPKQMAVRGWSYGGILGGWTITQTTRFKAASLGAMVTDWPSEYALGFNHDVRLWYIGGTPWDNAEAWRQMSSYSHIGRVETPTLLLHGERDTTDSPGQSMMFYQALKDRGVPVRFIRFPREPHGFREPHHQRARDTEEIAWLMKYTRGIDWKAPERK